jgi:hypothetical protein
MKDVGQCTREELQALLDEIPQLEPTPMLDNGRMIILSIVDGIPQITCGPIPEFDCDLPDVASKRGTPLFRIYHLLKDLASFEEENQTLSAAAMQIQAVAPTPAEGLRIEPPTMPSIPEIVISSAGGNNGLRLQEDKNGMYRNLESLQAHLRDALAKNPELPPLVIKTAKENIEVGVTGGELAIRRSAGPGQPYTQIRNTPQARLLLIARTIQGLEEKLYGSTVSIKVAKAPVKLSASENLAQTLDEISCGNIAVQIRSRKRTLYLSGTDKVITYRGLQTTLEAGKLIDENVSEEPTGYTQVEYGALPRSAAAVLQAYWAYISPKSAKKEQPQGE